jgi:hypothetical protein
MEFVGNCNDGTPLRDLSEASELRDILKNARSFVSITAGSEEPQLESRLGEGPQDFDGLSE